jgi:wyosine [tRNA(Phe)-imidazoG37] synthetase (radical SAM superfamily)
MPSKICSYDCIYCQLGRTTNKTTDLREYVPVDGVLDELAERLRAEPRPDFIGLAGSGESTLQARLADLITGIKGLTSIPVAVLTNGSLLPASVHRRGDLGRSEAASERGAQTPGGARHQRRRALSTERRSHLL